MDIKITPAKLRGSIAAIPSKSHAQRVLIASALSDARTIVHMGNVSQDIQSMVEALTSLGAQFVMEDDRIIVHPIVSGRLSPDRPTINCGESGTAARLLLPVAASLYKSAAIDGAGSLRDRPFRTLCDAMEQNGCRFEDKRLPIMFHNGIKPGHYLISGGESSQYISGLLYALPLLDGDSTITLTSPLQSSGYVDMTVQTLKCFGVDVGYSETGYEINGNQQYISPGHVTVEGDWSNAAFWHAAGITVTGLDENSTQKDKLFRSIKEHRHIDIAQVPDLAPILSICCALRQGDTRISNISRLRLKESDRVVSVVQMLGALGTRVTVREDDMIIHGKGHLRGGLIDGMNDHRIIMSAAIASCFCEKDVVIQGAQAAHKSYVRFFEDFNQLGGNAIVL